MTKIKNTKKGMAKKTLSMSLVVAMLATSNVPVWAAEFSDGTDAAVTSEAEAPVVEDTTTDEFTSEATPEVATEETVAPATAKAEVNEDNYISTIKVKMNAKGWNNKVEVTGNLKDQSGKEIQTWDPEDKNRGIQVSYVWLIDGAEANGTGTNGILNTSEYVKNITYTPVKEDFNKTLSLMVTVKRGSTTIFQQTVEGGVVGPCDLTENFKNVVPTFTNNKPEYNGKEQKLTPDNTDEFKLSSKVTGEDITSDFFTWNYANEKNDFTNVTGKAIQVTGTLDGTYDKTSKAYGYTATTGTGTYTIQKKIVANGDLSALMKTTSVEYTGSEQEFGKSDVTLQVKVNEDGTKVDITDALKKDAKFTGDKLVKDGYNLTVKTSELDNIATSENAKKVLNNLDMSSVSNVNVLTSNTYNIVKRDLYKCTGEVNTDFEVDDIKNAKDSQAIITMIENEADNISFKGQDGRTFTLTDIKDDVTVNVEQALINAAAKGTTGVVNNAITISYKADTKNVTGKITLPVRLTTKNLNADVKVTYKGKEETLSTNAKAPTDFTTKLNYIADAYDLTANKYFSEFKVVDKTSNEALKTGEYKITYDNNVDAGTVKVTVTGLGSYAGSVRNYYFKINANTVSADSIDMKKKVTVNTANNADASKYKDALGLSIKQELYTGNGKTTLALDKDYTVNYYYVKAGVDVSNFASEDDAQAANVAGSNIAGDQVCAVINVKKGNYNKDTFFKAATIEAKSISGVTIELSKDSYTYTAKEIVPEVVVKDGSSVLEKGVDYSLQVKDNKDVGTATVTIKALTGSDYAVGSTATKTFSITAAKAENVTVTFKDEVTASATPIKNADGEIVAFAYNKGKQIKPKVDKVFFNGVEVTSQFDTTYVTYGDNNAAGKDMGTVTIAPKATNKNFTGTKTQTFDIKGKELNGKLKVYGSNKKQISTEVKKDVEGNDFDTRVVSWDKYHFYYNNAECKFADEAFLPNPVAATEGTDYEIKYINNVDAGYGFVAVVAKGNYEGDYTYNYKYKDKKDNTVKTHHYLVDEYEVIDGKLKLGDTVLQNNIVDIIAFQIKASTFTAKNVTVTNGVYASGLPVKPQVTVSVAGKALVEGKDYKLNIRPQSSDKGFTYPDSVINATSGKIFYVDVIPMGGYEFDDVDGSNTFAWGIDKFDFAAADITSSGDTVTVKNGTMTVDPSDYTVTKDETAGTVTVAAKEGSKNYTGSQTVKVNNVQVQAPVISGVNVVGNKATVILSGESDGASGYDYVISKANDYSTERVDVTKNQIKTTGDFKYVQQGTYFAYCHAWTRDANGKKVFSGWSNIYPFSVTAITPDAPVITNVKVSGSTIKVTYKAAANATGYDVVLGTGSKKENGETRPYNYGAHKVLNLKEGTVTATFKNVPKGTWTVGMHAFNRTSENGKKVFSKWSNLKKATVK